MKTDNHRVDFCVVGGGLAGLCAAVSCARKGLKVVLMHDRPVLGGNASSEIRMWVCGAHGENMRETGIIEEIQMENLYRNNYPSYAVWDSILYEKAAFQENLTLLLNCSCNDAVVKDSHIVSIKGWQLTTETWHIVEADYFADCSGDSILAPLSGALFRYGREACGEFNESIAPEKADDKTMGMSCLLQARETDSAQKFIPPSWAYKFENDEKLANRRHLLSGYENFWWLEVGGEIDSIHGAEINRGELLKIGFGIWDHIKNHGDHGAENWVLEWTGFLPGKRESRRYVGDYILTQNDVRAEGRFDDIIAYGGWSMDDHNPAGFYHPGEPTIFHPSPSPYGIPYRSVYSKNIENLFFAGRNISATHSAMSSTRVMSTCAILGQAIGTAAAIAAKNSLSPRGVYEQKIGELKQSLMEDDCYLPWNFRNISKLSSEAKLSASNGNPEMLRNGVDRPVENEMNSWQAAPGDFVEFRFDSPKKIEKMRFVFDSNLKVRLLNMPALRKREGWSFKTPETLVSDFHIEVFENNKWRKALIVKDNHQRLLKIETSFEAEALRFVLDKTHGSEKVNIFAIDIQ
ncbi:MAG: hypothetical protein A2020_05530 [Lentisphaerae bacterium GWF2_45_14]|nr:MAG: hypothetical protein A2020_05530 [Lentisphaerae bacterium GWF2_45_14]